MVTPAPALPNSPHSLRNPMTYVLSDIMHILESSEDISPRLYQVLELLQRLIPYGRCALLEVQSPWEQRLLIVPASSSEEQDTLRQLLLRLLRLVKEHAVPADLQVATGLHLPWRSYLAVPLVSQDQVIGVLYVGKAAPDAYGEQNLRLLSIVASQLSAYLTMARLMFERERADEERKAETRFLRAQTEVAQVALSSLDPKALAPRLLEAIARVQGYAYGFLGRVTADDQGGEIVATCGPETAQFLGVHRNLNAPDSLVGHAIRSGHPVFVNRVRETSFASDPIARALHAEALCALPLVDRSGSPIGALLFAEGKKPDRFTERDLVQGAALASQVALALENSELFSQVQAWEAQHRAVTDSMSDAVYTVNAAGEIRFANAALEQLTGYPLQELLGQPSRKFYTPEVHPMLRERRRRGLLGDSVAPQVEVEMVRKDGARVPVALSAANLVVAGEVRGRATVLHDLTERRRAEAEVERQRREAEVLTELAQTISASLNLPMVLPRVLEGARSLSKSDIASIALREPISGAMVIRHSTGARYQGYETIHIQPGRGIGGLVLVTGRPVRTDHYAEDPRISQEYLDVIRAEQIVSAIAVPISIGDDVEGVIYLANRTPRPYSDQDEAILQRVADHAAIAIHNARLFAEMRAGRERLQVLSRRLVEVQEAERRAIARELHDEVGQLLVGLNYQLDRSMSAAADATRASLGGTQALVADLLTRVRKLSLELWPAVLDHLGLLSALLCYFEQYTVRTQVRVDFKHSGLERRVGMEIETAVYRIVQEALTNVAQHAGAQVAVVRVWVDEVEVGVRIEDQGRGFELAAVLTDGRSGGLIGMEERALLLGGQLTVESVPGRGTCVTAEIPLGPSLPGEAERGR